MLNGDFFLLGNGSNLLVSDKGIRGAVIHLSKGFNNIDIKDNIITAKAGATLAGIARVAYDNSLTGFEFAAGIPGSLGGAIVMNAGAYDGEMKNVVRSVKLMDYNGNIVTKTNEEMHFSYRHSLLKEESYIVLEVEIALEKGDQADIKAKMDDLSQRRRDKQPLEYPSAGSTFKRPEGYFAAKLIDDAGLRGYSVGGAQVSTKHCGFVINTGNATATDVYTLINDVQNRVKKSSGVEIEPEVILVGEF
jgi:UDP-N-acetylmuramate dehydrogenase